MDLSLIQENMPYLLTFGGVEKSSVAHCDPTIALASQLFNQGLPRSKIGFFVHPRGHPAYLYPSTASYES